MPGLGFEPNTGFGPHVRVCMGTECTDIPELWALVAVWAQIYDIHNQKEVSYWTIDMIDVWNDKQSFKWINWNNFLSFKAKTKTDSE